MTRPADFTHHENFKPEGRMRRNIKDDVFCDLFSQKKYLVSLFEDLHPEIPTCEDDLEIVTIDRIVTAGAYNDLGFIAHDKLVVLVEAQSTWSPNISLRMMFYLTETYRRFIEETDLNLYSPQPASLPVPELHVIYTGNQEVPQTASFTHDLLHDAKSSAEITIDVITGSKGIAGEYVKFARRHEEISKLDCSPSAKTKMLLDGCIADGILSEYLTERYKEVGNIMFTLFDQEEITRRYERDLKEAAQKEGWEKGQALGLEAGMAEGKALGLAKGMAEGKAQGMAEGKAQGMAEGKAQGMAEGKAQGMAEGKIEAFAMAASKLSQNAQVSIDKAIEMLEIPDDLHAQVKELLAQL